MAICKFNKRWVSALCLLGLGGCGWVDDSGVRTAPASLLSMDEPNPVLEDSVFDWPHRDFRIEDEIVGFRATPSAAEGIAGLCSAHLPVTAMASSLRDACQPELSDAACALSFSMGEDSISVAVPKLRRPVALSYSLDITDALGEHYTRSVDLCVATTSSAPIANADTGYAVPYRGSVEHTGTQFDEFCVSQGGSGVLSNDTDDFDYTEGWDTGLPCLRAELRKFPDYAISFSLRGDGGFSYQSSGAAGPGSSDTFKYRISDGIHVSEDVEVSILITGVNEAPEPLNPSIIAEEDAPQDLSLSELASDPEGDALKVVSFTQAAHGSVRLISGGVQFIPVLNFFGETSFVVTVADSLGSHVDSTVTVIVEQRNDQPEVQNLPAAFDVVVADPLALGEYGWSFIVSDEETVASLISVTATLESPIGTVRTVGPGADGRVSLLVSPLQDGESAVLLRLEDQPVGDLPSQVRVLRVPLVVTGMQVVGD